MSGEERMRFDIAGGEVTAAYEFDDGRWEREYPDVGERWVVEGNSVVEIEQEYGREERTTYTDPDGDGIYLGVDDDGSYDDSDASAYDDTDASGADDTDASGIDDTDASGADDTDATGLDDDDDGGVGNSDSRDDVMRFDIVNGEVVSAEEYENGAWVPDVQEPDERWVVEGNDVVEVEQEGNGLVERTVFSDADGDGVYRVSSISTTSGDGTASTSTDDDSTLEPASMTSTVSSSVMDDSLRYEAETAQAYRLYEAAFNRTPDAEGLRYWADELETDMSLEDVANAFVESPEFETRYGANISDEEFVTRLYENVLDRAPDAGGKAYWLGELEGELDRDDVLVSFSESPENQQNLAGVVNPGDLLDDILVYRVSSISTTSGDGTASTSTDDDSTLEPASMTSTVSSSVMDDSLRYEAETAQAYRLYEAAFNRTPDAEGLRYWADELETDMSLEDVANAFVESPEFETRYGANISDEEFVTRLYENVLDRAPDAGGKAYWLGELEGELDRDDVLVSFSESPENQQNLAGVVNPGDLLDDILV
ncbi:DUF4214 domain-containing protein [Spiribacter insolitus]|uniref:DUF4214 domain-containing protein n=1 Tax=Spiribacter insolitus TaxID=3122417 RepID=A0ABV3T8Z7_9GAMM